MKKGIVRGNLILYTSYLLPHTSYLIEYNNNNQIKLTNKQI